MDNMKLNKTCIKFINEFVDEINRTALIQFYDWCYTNKLNSKTQLNLILKWIKIFEIYDFNISADKLIDFCDKRMIRKKKLITNNKNPSIIDQSFYEIYVDSDTALSFFNKMKSSKKNKNTKWNSENPQIGLNQRLISKIKLHGDVDGKYEYEKMIKLAVSKTAISLDYWLKLGLSLEEAKAALSQRQATFTLEKCIKKFGEIAGLQKWRTRQEKWQTTLNNKSDEEKVIINLKKNNFSVEGVMLRGYSKEEAEEMVKTAYEKYLHRLQKKVKNNASYSQEATKFILDNIICDDALFCDKEWFIYDHEAKKHYFYDFTNLKKKVIFEYHGEKFHPNYRIMTENEIDDWVGLYKIVGPEKLEYDKRKKDIAEKNGFKFFEIFSNDTEETKQTILKDLNKCLM